MIIRTYEQLKEIKVKELEKENGYVHRVQVCYGAGCMSAGCKDVYERLEELLVLEGLTDTINVNRTGCIGSCELGPSLYILPEGVYYPRLSVDDLPEIVERHLKQHQYVLEKTYWDIKNKVYIPLLKDIPFFMKQQKIVMENCGIIDYGKIESYIAHDGYEGLYKALNAMSQQDVIESVKSSGLRGRGGGGFLTGTKWKLGHQSVSEQKYMICNADEGDPGAFMDRCVLEGDPHRIIEGMAIGAYAIGADKGIVYIRAEYPLAVQRLDEAMKVARQYGLLGEKIFDTDFNFDIEIRTGAGAFVCGEETALIHSVEGKRGEPSQKPPFPSEKGLFGKPTVINNVETLANIPSIIRNGSDWYTQYGTSASPGTKVFALAGAVKNCGIVEVPLGITLGEIIYEVGGGIKRGKLFKAAQTGGPSGGCLTSSALNVPIDYDTLKEKGAIMGSGGLICMDEDNCMVDVARFFMEFIQDESCGKCVPCRIGTKRMLEILERITQGQGKMEDIDLLIELGETIKKTALCGLGQTAPNPVLSTLREFREEYEEHILEKKCRAGVCKELFISPCQNACPAGVNIPGYLALVSEGRMGDAFNLIRRDNPFPAVCGRVCTHPCESKCQRSMLDEPLAIADIKRFVADTYYEDAQPFLERRFPPKGKSVGIIGAGPSGLTCGYYLSLSGYDVTIYEELDEPGGILRFGIPEYRLPKETLHKEIEYIKQSGIKILLNTKVGEHISFETMRQTHDAIYISTGTQFSNHIGIEGETLNGVTFGLDFLKEVNSNQRVAVGKIVGVIGGGSTALDAARTAIRLGAKEVHIFYRRVREDMPADPREVEEALEEGAVLHTLVSPKRIVGDAQGNVTGLEYRTLIQDRYDQTGRRKSVEANEPVQQMDLDMVIPAVSQHSDLPFISKEDVEMTSFGTFVIDTKSSMTKINGVFAGGDVVRGPDTVIAGIADGKTAAKHIDRYLGGDGNINQGQAIRIPEAKDTGTPEEHMRFERRMLEPKRRIQTFAEVSQGYHRLNAIAESMRCLRCDRR